MDMNRETDCREGDRSVSRGIHRRLCAGVAIAGCAALGLTACKEDLAPQFVVTGTGSVEGLVFYDVVEDGVFDPASGDVPIAGVGVSIEGRGTGTALAGGTATSGANGRFVVSGLPAGTHDMRIDTLTVPVGVSICQNPLQVTVNLDETRFSQIRGRSGCLITIQAAKEGAQGEFVIVRGIVTSSPGQVESGWTFIQDATAGARAFGGLDGLGIEIGDQVEIGAVAGNFTNDFEFGSVVFRGLVQDVGVLSPRVVTTAEVAASGVSWTEPLQGLLITIEKAELTAAFGAGGANIQNGIIDDGSGAITIRIDDGVADRNSLNDILTVGLCYDITGFGANFAGAGQIFPRSLADIVEVSCN
jgi:DNA/RNA endonuclease YhcR with UshA esterase domain